MCTNGHKYDISFYLNSWKSRLFVVKSFQNGIFKISLTEEIRKNDVRVIKKMINTEIFTQHCSYRCLLIPTSCWFNISFTLFLIQSLFSSAITVYIVTVHVEITSFRIWCNVCSKDSLLDSKWLDKIKRLAYQIICSKSRLKGSNSYTLSTQPSPGARGGGLFFFFAKLYITIIKDLPPFFSLVKIFYQSSPPPTFDLFLTPLTIVCQKRIEIKNQLSYHNQLCISL